MSGAHTIVAYDREQLVGCCHQARCSCGWRSDSYAALADAQRVGEVHLRRSRREEFDALIAKSSIGAALADIKERGLEKHLESLEEALWPKRQGKNDE